MKKINLINKNYSDVNYNLITFPDGEPHIKIDDIDRKQQYSIICRVSNPTELFILMQVGSILKRQGVIFDIHIRYLMGMRMDRVISFNEAFSLEIVANCINSLGASRVYIFEAHSDRTFQLIENSEPETFSGVKCFGENVTICYPDKGAVDRYSNPYDEDNEFVVLDKKRDLTNGKIISLEVAYEPSEVKDEILIVDDLCDAGGTFVWAAKILREKYPDKKISLYVKHLVNEIGYKNLTDNFDKVYITNSYRDWGTNDVIKVTDLDK